VKRADEFNVKFIDLNDLITHKGKIVGYFEDNFKINFPDSNCIKSISLDSYENMLIHSKSGSAIIVGGFKEDELISFLWAYEKSFLNERRAHITHIIVDSNHRGNGIGRRLLSELEKYLLSIQIETIELMTSKHNMNTLHFYQNTGFDITRLQLEKRIGDKVDKNQ